MHRRDVCVALPQHLSEQLPVLSLENIPEAFPALDLFHDFFVREAHRRCTPLCCAHFASILKWWNAIAIAIPSNLEVLTAAEDAEAYNLAALSISSKAFLSFLGSALLKRLHSQISWDSTILNEGIVLPI